MDGAGHGTPRYLLDTYPSTLTEDPPRLAALAGDAGWVTAAIQTLGVDAVLAELKRLAPPPPANRGWGPCTPWWAAGPPPARPGSGRDPGFVPRQLCLQATELGETLLAADFRTRQLATGDPGPVLQWTTRRASPALSFELGRHDRLAGHGGAAGWAGGHHWRRGPSAGVGPGRPGAGPVKLGRHQHESAAAAALPDGRVVAGDHGGGSVWDPAQPGAARSSSAASPRAAGEGGGGAAGRTAGQRR